jgi:hypothetical protein
MDTNRGPRVSLPLSDDKNMSPPPAPPAVPEGASLEERVVAALRTCYDPEIPVDIYELGLIYDLQVTPAGEVGIRMTLTSPACPVADLFPEGNGAGPGLPQPGADVLHDAGNVGRGAASRRGGRGCRLPRRRIPETISRRSAATIS